MYSSLRYSLSVMALLVCLGTASYAEAQSNPTDKSGATLLMRAAMNGNIAHVKSLIAAHVDVNAKDNCDNTALMDAAKTGSDGCVKVLIAAHANVNTQGHGEDLCNDYYTALMYAANVRCIQVLVAAGANVNARDGDGETALLIAARAGRTDCVKALIKAGADVNAKAYYNGTALGAAGTNHPEITAALKAAGEKE